MNQNKVTHVFGLRRKPQMSALTAANSQELYYIRMGDLLVTTLLVCTQFGG